jgi:DNA-binding transcriptional ArsR family regulator
MTDQDVFRALADGTRRAILGELGGGSRTAGELAELFPITRASLSHHFSVLKSAGLIRARRDGQSIVYSLNTSVVEDLTRLVLDIFDRESNAAKLRESP